MNVAVLGDVMLDVVVAPVGPLSATSDTPSRVRVGRGGSGANLAIALARTGHDVTYLGAAGRDGAAALWRGYLAEAGVHARLEEVDAATGVVVALVGGDGQRSMYTDRGANSLLTGLFVETALAAAFAHAEEVGAHGKDVTPVLLAEFARYSAGAS
ncbi:MAG TPA: carbohydrate kinase family protein, partial [Acidimicrobiales bacterium]|nr:carbohydrate kinase family protein [Acidimicrobiales bacterium]